MFVGALGRPAQLGPPHHHCAIMSTTQNALSHGVTALPPSLSADLAFLAGLSADQFGAFCAAARELLRKPDDTSMFPKAARSLGVDVEQVESSIRALCFVLISGATSGRGADNLLTGVSDFALPDSHKESLATFYKDVGTELEQELRKGFEMPRYRGLDWRLQVRVAGRYTPRQAPQPSFLLRVHTSDAGGAGQKQHLIQADLTNLRRMTSELEAALAEDKSTHSRRIARRL